LREAKLYLSLPEFFLCLGYGSTKQRDCAIFLNSERSHSSDETHDSKIQSKSGSLYIPPELAVEKAALPDDHALTPVMYLAKYR
jgi:hypothetical protein